MVSRPNTKVHPERRIARKEKFIYSVLFRLGLQALYDKYKDQGLEILGFPCNQVCSSLQTRRAIPFWTHFKFGGQEPADDQGIADFCTRNHGVSFPLMKKSDVNGDDTNEVYKWLKTEKSGLLGLTRIKVCLNALKLSKGFDVTAVAV